MTQKAKIVWIGGQQVVSLPRACWFKEGEVAVVRIFGLVVLLPLPDGPDRRTARACSASKVATIETPDQTPTPPKPPSPAMAPVADEVADSSTKIVSLRAFRLARRNWDTGHSTRAMAA